MKINRVFSIVLFGISLLFVGCKSTNQTANNWNQLIDKDLSQWDVFIGVPHHSLDLEGYEKGDGKRGTPIGLNNDPLNVFSVVEMDDEQVLKVSGEVYGGLSTKQEFENYHLSLEFKWGTKKYEPRLQDKRDSGILYHAQEPHGQFWNVWMKSLEMQVQEGDCGDFFALAGTGIDIKSVEKTEVEKAYRFYSPDGELRHFKSGEDSRCRRIKDLEKPNGEWNKLELVCVGNKAYHIVNGTVVMVMENPVMYDEQGNSSPLTKGKIQLQSEGAELYYKNIKIRSVKGLPQVFQEQLY